LYVRVNTVHKRNLKVFNYNVGTCRHSHIATRAGRMQFNIDLKGSV